MELNANDVQIKIFESNTGVEVEREINEWLSKQPANIMLYDINVKNRKILINPGEEYPHFEWGFMGVVTYSKLKSEPTSEPKSTQSSRSTRHDFYKK